MKNNPESRLELWKRAVIVLVAAVFVLAVGYFALRNINKSLFEERSNNIKILMGRIAMSIEDSFEKEWNYLTYFKNVFSRASVRSLDEAKLLLKEMEEDSSHNIERMLLIGEDGFCYPSEGMRFQWNDQRDLLADEKTCTIYTSEFPHGGYKAHMYFLLPFETPFVLDGMTMTHISMAVSIEFVDTFFAVDEFGEHSATFVLSTDGSRIYWQEAGNPLSGVQNVLHALEEAEFYYDASLWQISDDFANQREGCVGLEHHGTAYYLAYEPLSFNRWMSVVLIEQETFSIGTKGFAMSIITSLLFVAVVTFASIIVIIMVAVRAANRRLRNAVLAEQKANAAKTNFLSAMSHDIRTPMNAVFGMTTLAIEHIDDREYVKNCLEKVKISSQHLLTLINDILDISKVESGQMSLHRMDLSLREEADRLVSIIMPQVNDKNQEFEIHTEGLQVDAAHADKLRLNQIMLNLLSNAVKYTPAGGKIRVELRSEQIGDSDRMRFVYTVSDTGIGMSKEFQEKMYQSFVRENNAPQRTIQGTGLGLTICKQMVDLMGGTIACDSEVGEGTTFTVTVEMPMAAIQQEETGADRTDPEAGENVLSGLRVLVVEDNDFNWEIAKELLAMHGILTTRAENGQIAVERMTEAADGAFDLILMDIQMPVMNGYLATTRIRASSRPYLKKIPIVAMTADAFSEDIQRCTQVGMNAHVSKPIDLDILINVIKEIKFGTAHDSRVN